MSEEFLKYGDGSYYTCEWKGHEGREATWITNAIYLHLCNDEHISTGKFAMNIPKRGDGTFRMVPIQVNLGEN